MAPKKAKPNAFLFYMIEQKPLMEKIQGRKLKMCDMPSLVHAEWKALSAAKKEKYVRMCDSAKQSSEKVDSRGIPLRQLENEIKNIEIERRNMEKNIRSTVDSSMQGKGIIGISNITIHIISFQIYGKLADGLVIPAEVGIVQFNLKKGVISEFHRIIEAEIPTGYQYEVSTTSQCTHNLFELRNHEVLKKDSIPAKFLLDEILSYISKETSATASEHIIYAQKGHLEIAKNILEKDHSPIKLYSLDFLYMLMCNFSDPESYEIPISIAEDALRSSYFDYNPNPACDFHKKFLEDSVNFCALSEVKRYCYNMCTHIDIKKKFNIEPIVGKHLPFEISSRKLANVLPMRIVTPDLDRSSYSNVNEKKIYQQDPEESEDSLSETMDNFSMKSDIAETISLNSWRKDKKILSTKNHFLQGAWATPSSPIGAIDTESDKDFPSLGVSSRPNSRENPIRDASQVGVSIKPIGVKSAYASVGLPGFGRGKTFQKK